jgi:hypothetical protein
MVGEHIRTRRDGHWDHAIDCGDQTVIHLADEAGAQRVRRSYRPEFLAGAEAVEIVTHREGTFPPREVVARAYSRIADPALAAMFRDSEAFASWCETGRLPPGPTNVAVPEALAIAPASPAAARTAAKPPAKAKRPAVKAKPKAPKALAKAKAAAPRVRVKGKAKRPARAAKPARSAPRGGRKAKAQRRRR